MSITRQQHSIARHRELIWLLEFDAVGRDSVFGAIDNGHYSDEKLIFARRWLDEQLAAKRGGTALTGSRHLYTAVVSFCGVVVTGGVAVLLLVQ